jgi:UrcA family protein
MNYSFRSLTGRAAAIALAASLAAVSAGTALAAPAAEDAPSTTVRYGDLNLATEKGARILFQRISNAAKQVCPDADYRDLSSQVRARTCQKEAVERAVREVKSPHLAALFAKAHRQG